MRKITVALGGLLLVWMAALPAKGQAQDEAPRNVVLILSDDHRYDFMGFHERAPAFLETPNFDRMAREGAHLMNAFVALSLCSPSRASILTGQYAHHHGVVDNQHPVPEGTRFFPQDLQEAGYTTAFIGKWHMGSSSAEPRPGFDHWVSFRGQGRYFDPVLNVNGERVETEGYITDILTEYALDWLEEREGDGPFFLILSHKAVHANFMPAPRHEGRYVDADVPHPETMANTEANYRDKPEWVRDQRYSWHGVEYMYQSGLDFDTFYRNYAETVLALDESIGRVLDYVDGSGLPENTLTLYMSDNGFLLGEHGLIDKRNAYEESIRIPMLAYAPGFLAPGTEITEMVRNIDVAPTMLDLAGLPVPDEMDGRSVLPMLRGEAADWSGELLYEYYWEYPFPHTPTTFALRGDRYKFIFYHGIWDLNEFYDLETDPQEQHNLINVPAYQDEITQMRTRLWELMEDTGGMQIPLRPSGAWQADEQKLYD